MDEQEGVIRFQMQFVQAPPMPYDQLRGINAWRKVLYLTELIGQDPARYDGFGYGNISQWMGGPSDGAGEQAPRPGSGQVPRPGSGQAPRSNSGQARFVISGTQTGHLADLTAAHYATVLACYPERNLVVAEGPIRPSSESMTHGMVYAVDQSVRCAIHVHSPHIWHNARALGMPITDESVAQGTPQMAEEVQRLFEQTPVREHMIFAMGGHTDGVVSFGGSVEEAGSVVIRYLARALQMEG